MANSNRQKQVNVTAPTPPPSAASSGSLSPKPDPRVSGQQSTRTAKTQVQDLQPIRDASVSPLDPPLLSIPSPPPNRSQRQVNRNGVDPLSRRPNPPASISNPAAQTKSKTQPFFYPSASTSLSTPSSLSGGTTTLTYHLITKHLALLTVIPTAVYEERKGLVEYNVVFFREGVQEICDVEDEVRGGG